MTPAIFRLTADLVVVVHATFVLFVVLGALLVMRWPRVAWAHVPAAAWGVLIELRGGVCPLTPLENSLRERGGSTPYAGDFIEHYVLPVLYPAHLTPNVQFWLGSAALIVNLLLYGLAIRRRVRRSRPNSRY